VLSLPFEQFGESPPLSCVRTLFHKGRCLFWNFRGLCGKETGVRAEAFEELFELHFEAVFGCLARRVGPELGRDLASETFTCAFAGRKRYDAARAEARPWL
jgi:hypothetical protein